MRRSAVLSLLLQLVFPEATIIILHYKSRPANFCIIHSFALLFFFNKLVSISSKLLIVFNTLTRLFFVIFG